MWVPQDKRPVQGAAGLRIRSAGLGSAKKDIPPAFRPAILPAAHAAYALDPDGNAFAVAAKERTDCGLFYQSLKILCLYQAPSFVSKHNRNFHSTPP